MSAIGGIWRFDGKPNPAADCARILAAQQIYGPHHGAAWSQGPLAMGRRLFRTLPEDAADRQPQRSRDDRLVLVADLRLDNRDDLIAALGWSRDAATAHPDAEILLACLERWQQGALDRLVGEFAFVLWHARSQTLWLARDFIGHRPLHYHRCRDFFAFASMPKGLHALPDVPYGPDEQTMAEFVTLMPQAGSRTFFKDIARVEPAHIVTVTRDGITSRRYWNPRGPRGTLARANDYADGLRHHLDQATQSRLRGASGIVGTHLSAGFDSASVTATAARLLAPQGGKVVAFTAVPSPDHHQPAPANRLDNEGPLAATTAALYANVEHVPTEGSGASPLTHIDRLFFLHEAPTLNPCNAVWSNAIDQAARRRGLTVVLNGQMGNMTLSYNGLALLPELLRAGKIRNLWREMTALAGSGHWRWRSVLAATFGPFMPVPLWQWLNVAATGRKRDVLAYTAIRPEQAVALDLYGRARQRHLDFAYRPRRDGVASRLWALSRVDLGNSGKAALAGWGVDHRDPTADKRLVEYCLNVPTDQYLAHGTTRALAKRALADRLPQAVLQERRRGYQGADWYLGLNAARADIGTELERLRTCAAAVRTLDLDRMKRLVDNWPQSNWNRPEVIEAYRCALLRGLSAGHFLRKAVGIN